MSLAALRVRTTRTSSRPERTGVMRAHALPTRV